ncbi:acyl-CoA reductase [Mesonia maritima]|uniref:Acyl-CoA reductase n=1 Tax=Mesonia maritima TaxID=1793873 RepID=A0ABU1KAU4_9FLAO|nr:acyl-CoA reductase [Mesonia maritima]MDR6302157.1 hypothetical protein [Mesonia maritima]
MSIETRKEAFVKLGDFLNKFIQQKDTELEVEEKLKPYAVQLQKAVEDSIHYNGWFTKENIYFSLEQWANALKKEKLENWLKSYSFSDKDPKTVAIIMAGNIPLVGFHDFLCVQLSGNKTLIKQSSNDKLLLPALLELLKFYAEDFNDSVEIAKEQLKDFDAVIATGSNNTARYFEYYFSKKPHIIRKNRNSVAILTGKETSEELHKLGEDIFRYYGLGCRNVSKLLVPENYDFKTFFEAIYDWNPIINQHKYVNNYDYNKAVYLMSNQKLFDNNFLILKEDQNFASPIGCLFYEYYKNEEQLKNYLTEHTEDLQCVVSSKENHISFGKTQMPKLTDYADNVDTMAFLTNLS